jgi:thiamine biosynthesis lipoprotein
LLGEAAAARELALKDLALSASGTTVKGAHLIDPRSGQPATRTTRVWASAASAALSDALSTAFFVMSDEEVAAFCAAHPEIGAALTAEDGALKTFGALGSPEN